MQKKRRNIVNSLISMPALAALIICAAAYFVPFCVYYQGPVNVYHALLSLQFPLLRCVEYQMPALPEPPAQPQAADSGIKIELVSSEPPMVDLAGSKPRILIYHTHATEAYFKTKESDYANNGAWRTLESDKNVTAVGKKLADTLRTQYGVAVIHDTTNHEPPKLATAYSRSVVTMEKYREKYPSITMYIDLHRDSYGNSPDEIADYVTIGGKQYARMMFVVGTGKGATGTGYNEMPDFDANYALAQRITATLSGIDEKLVRSIRVKTGRYNQHISNQCLLVEIGHNANTLEQALNSVDYLAAAIAEAAGLHTSQLSLSP